jgi:hypothetical protein
MTEPKYWLLVSFRAKECNGSHLSASLWIAQFHLLLPMRFVLALCHSILWSPLHTTFSIFATVQNTGKSRIQPPTPNILISHWSVRIARYCQSKFFHLQIIKNTPYTLDYTFNATTFRALSLLIRSSVFFILHVRYRVKT